MSPRFICFSDITIVRSSSLVAAASLGLFGCSSTGGPAAPVAPGGEIAAEDDPGTDFPATIASQAIPNSYIVVFHPTTPDPAGLANQLVREKGGRVDFAFSAALRGFAGELPEQAVEALKHNPNVAYVEPDMTVQLFDGGTQAAPPAPWGLDRVDQRTLPLTASYTWGTNGTGVHVYIIDTGIRTTHQDFGGRAVWDFKSSKGQDPDTDCNGHGTHVAGTVGGTTYGVAKGVTLHAVKVLDCTGNGRWSWVIAGVDWVTAHAQRPAVVNMSIGGSKNEAMNDAVAASVRAGITYAVAAGNSATDACTFSPASEPTALTVGATTKLDVLASYSNVGSCVDLLAPGSSILSDWIRTDTDAVYLSGTSMATPHVTGAAALYLEGNPGATPDAVAAALIGSATAGMLTGVPTGTVNRLLFTTQGNQPGGGGGGSCVPSQPRSNNCK